MRLERAIEILSDEPETLDWENEPQAIDALRLGIEALKRLTKLRQGIAEPIYYLLPGETKE